MNIKNNNTTTNICSNKNDNKNANEKNHKYF